MQQKYLIVNIQDIKYVTLFQQGKYRGNMYIYWDASQSSMKQDSKI